MSEPAKKTDIDIAEYERRVRQAAPRSDDPLAELARLVNAAEPRRREPIDAIAPETRDALNDDERDFLNELSLALDLPPQTPPRSSPARDAAALARAEASINQAAAEAGQAALAAQHRAAEAETTAAEGAQVQEIAPGASGGAPSLPRAAVPFEHAAPSIEIPTLKAQAALRGGLDMHGLEEMTRLEDISRAEPEPGSVPAPPPKVDLNAPTLPRAYADFTPAPPFQRQPEPSARFTNAAVSARDLDDALPGDDRFEPAPAVVAAAARKPRGRRGMAALVALVGVSVAAGGVALTMKRGPQTANGEPPTIMASSEPVKVAPPAGLAAPADTADDLLARKTGKPDAGAKIVGRPEEPVDLAREAQKIVRTVPITGAQDPSVPRTPTGDSAAPDRLGSIFPEPRRVRTVSIRPDGTIIGADAAPKPPVALAPSAPVAIAPAPEATAPSRSALIEEPVTPRARPRAAAPVTPATQTPAATPPKRAEKPAPAPEKIAQQDKPAPARRVARAAPAAEEAPAVDVAAPAAEEAAPVEQVRNPFKTLFGSRTQPAAPATTASTGPAAADDDEPAPTRVNPGSGSYAVQLSSSPSEADARAAAKRLGGRYSSELGGRAARIVQGEAGGRTVYRVRVSGMSKEGANSSCASVKSSGGSCFVTLD